jgi:DNA repair exonuclease SbcCD ATPase subunit
MSTLDLAQTHARLTKATNAYAERVGRAKALAATYRESVAEAEQCTEQIATAEEAVGFLNSYAGVSQSALYSLVESIVNAGLEAVFPDAGLRFELEVSQKANRTSVAPRLTSRMKDGEEWVEVTTSILDARGGGVAAVTSFLLRVAVLMLKDSPEGSRRRLLMLDETFGQLSRDHLRDMGIFIRDLVDKAGLQIILVTHSDEIAELADTVYQVSLVDGATVAERLR